MVVIQEAWLDHGAAATAARVSAMLKTLLLILALAGSAAADERVLLSSEVVLADKTGDTELCLLYTSDAADE